jgi:hypothetical protein
MPQYRITAEPECAPRQTPAEWSSGQAPHPFGWTPDKPATHPTLVKMACEQTEWWETANPNVVFFLDEDGTFYRIERVA